MRQIPLGIAQDTWTLSSKRTTIASDKPISRGSVNEIILATDSAIQPFYLLPMVAHISQDQRWLTWVAQETLITREWVASVGVKEEQVLLLSPVKQDLLSLCCKALAAGTAHMIIEWPCELEQWQLEQFQHAADQGSSHAIIIRRR